MTREPDFWWRPGSGSFLIPFAALYGAVAGVRLQSTGQRAGLPVICLGNLTVGGAGKTPAAIAVGQLLHAAHERPFFLSRGYGGQLTGPVRVNPALHRAARRRRRTAAARPPRAHYRCAQPRCRREIRAIRRRRRCGDGRRVAKRLARQGSRPLSSSMAAAASATATSSRRARCGRHSACSLTARRRLWSSVRPTARLR